MKLLWGIFGLFLILTTQAVLANRAPTPQDIEARYSQIFAHNPEINHAALLRLLSYYDANLENINNKNVIIFVDFSIDSDQPRMFVIDMRDGSRSLILVGHGSGSDPRNTGKARLFSNIEGSKMSSLGIFRTDKAPFHGEYGLSLHMIGMETTNSKAYQRGILLHGANYIAEGMHPLGRSEGCFAMELQKAREVIDLAEGGSVLMSWIDPKLLAP